DYFFKANDAIQASSYGLPGGYSPAVTSTELTLPYQFGFGLNVGRYKNDFEDAIDGWELGLSTDDASDGIWEQGVPGGTTSGGQQVQTDKDHTTGTGKCLITGNGQLFGSVSDDDVDNGLTTARTPVFDLPFYEPVIEYYRWYSNDRGSNSNARSDYWTVEIRTPNSGLWKRVDYTKESDQRWRRRVFRVSEYLPGASAIQMQFIAEDRKIGTLSGNGQNVVEAAVDDFLIYEGAPAGVENTGLAVQSKVYPNPADNMVHVTVPGGSNGSINLYDITGRTISITNVTDAKIEYGINTRDLPSGTYMILIQTQYAVQNTTVVVSHN
ncbi:MAG: T9SS type A sorting domain-containing protein, partial [Chitinophagaceae bacterium]|nr:T9SS type A sorting domain-containing protein [Chitinophagaceae bacterium]